MFCSDESSEECKAAVEANDVEDERKLEEDDEVKEEDFSDDSLEESLVEPVFKTPFRCSRVFVSGNGTFRTISINAN